MVRRHIASYFWVNIKKCRRNKRWMHLNYNNQLFIKRMFSSYIFRNIISMSCILLLNCKEKALSRLANLVDNNKFENTWKKWIYQMAHFIPFSLALEKLCITLEVCKS